MLTPVTTPRSRVSRELIAAMRWCIAHASLADDELAYRLYVDWYLRADPADAGEMLGAARPEDADPVAAYRAAHALDARFEDGWQVIRVSTFGRVQVGDGVTERIVDRADVLGRERVLLPPRPGDAVAVTARRDIVDESGFWFTFLNGWPEGGRPEVVRFYWAVRRRGAPALIRLLTTRLPTGVPAALKVGAAAHLLGRPDAAVLYAGVEDAAALTPLLRLCAGELQDSLAARIPPLTLELSRGLAVAEDPGDGQSFGQHRCGLLVRAARSHDHGADDDTLLQAARAALSSAGVDPVNPHRARESMVGDRW